MCGSLYLHHRGLIMFRKTPVHILLWRCFIYMTTDLLSLSWFFFANKEWAHHKTFKSGRNGHKEHAKFLKTKRVGGWREPERGRYGEAGSMIQIWEDFTRTGDSRSNKASLRQRDICRYNVERDTKSRCTCMKKKISTWDEYEGKRVKGRGVQSLIPTGKTFRLDLSFSLRIRGFDKTFNQNQNQFSLGVIFTSSTPPVPGGKFLVKRYEMKQTFIFACFYNG